MRIVQRVNSKAVILYKIRSMINSNSAVQIYRSLILPVLEYGDLFLTSCTTKSLEKLQKLQNRLLRVAISPNIRTSNFDLHLKAKVLPVSYRRILSILRVMFFLSFSNSRLVSNPANRSGHSFMFNMPFPRSKLFQVNICYLGRKCWNSLPRHIRMMRNYKMFKKKVKHLLFSQFVRERNLYHNYDLANLDASYTLLPRMGAYYNEA